MSLLPCPKKKSNACQTLLLQTKILAVRYLCLITLLKYTRVGEATYTISLICLERTRMPRLLIGPQHATIMYFYMLNGPVI